MIPNEKDKLDSRIALLNYSRSKVSEHIGYVLSFVLVFFTLYNTEISDSIIFKFFKIDNIFVSILLMGPLVYMVGRTFFWTAFTTAIFRIKHSSEERCDENSPIDEEFEEYNLFMAYNNAATLWVIRRTDIFGLIGKFFYKSSKLIWLTSFSLILAPIYWVIINICS